MSSNFRWFREMALSSSDASEERCAPGPSEKSCRYSRAQRVRPGRAREKGRETRAAEGNQWREEKANATGCKTMIREEATQAVMNPDTSESAMLPYVLV